MTAQPVAQPADRTAAPIRELPPPVAAQIAAGEVVERPAAALKELLENALDAGARRITAAAEGAGLERLAVHDDGCGIPADQLELAFRRHATSKLAAAEQLWSLRSYGFRGEALPALAAAAGRLEADSRPAAAPGGARIVFEQGRLLGVERSARSAGSSVELRELFAAQPARRAFLPGPRSERAALARVASDAALARPDVGLRLELDGRPTLRHDPAAGNAEAALREAWAAVFGADAAERAIWWAASDDDSELSVDGLAGAPRDGRRGRDGLRLFVNGRPVRDRSLAWALQEAYRGWLPAGRFPLVVARLSLPPDAVDVNVHPTKAEVQLREPARAFGLVQRSLREALAAQPQSASLRLRRPDPDLEWVPLSPDAGATQARIDALPQPPAATLATAPLAAAPSAADPLAGPRRALPAPESEPTPQAQTQTPRPPQRRLAPLRMVGQLHRTFIIAEGEQGLVLVDQHAAHERVVYERLLAAQGAGQRARQPLLDPPLLQLAADESAVWREAGERLDALGFELDIWRPGRVGRPDAGDGPDAELDAGLGAGPDAGRAAGLDAEFGAGRGAGPNAGPGDALRLRAVPAAGRRGDDQPLNAAEAERWLREVLAELAADANGRGARGGAEQRFDPIAASVACHASIRRGAALDPPAMSALLRQLEACADPHSCPHGRPTFVEIASADLLREFGRT